MNVALGRVADRYEPGDIVGQGRSAVYRARDTRLGRDVALKRVLVAPDLGDPVSSSESPEDVRTRALREARATARVASAHAVDVYDLVEEGDAVWLVMELVDAPSLERLVAAEGPLDETRAARIGLAVLDALAAAHAEGIVHRDVKPANVLVGEPTKLADFGVAALRDESELTQPGMVVGSPSYMAPEQASAGEVGPEADMWALGALLYFAIEGAPPFAAGSALATAAAVVHSPVRPQRRPGRLSPVIARLLAKNPAARPGPADVRRMLASVAAGAAATDATLAAMAAAATQISRDVAPAPGGDPSTLVAPAATPPSGSGRRRPRRLALAALAVVVAGVAAAAGIAQAGGDRDTPPARARPPATAPTTEAPVVTTTAPSAPAQPQGKAKGKGKHKAPASGEQGNQAAATPTTTAAATPPTTATTVPPTTEPAPQDSVVTTPPTTAPAPTAPPTTAGAGGAASDPPPDPA